MKLKLYHIVFCCSLLSCGSSKKDDPKIRLLPTTLVFPEQNSACTSASINSPTTSTIEFKWSPVDHAKSYTISIQDLSDLTMSTQTINRTSAAITLKRNNAYSWFITTTLDGSSAALKSEVWKFYNPGPGATSFVPFQAENIYPYKGQMIYTTTGKINLSWKGSDADNDILNYDVYFGTTTSPALIDSALTGTTLANVAIAPKTDYFWKVVTRDKNNNTSESNLFYFSVR